jgi:hypothetical protein
LYNIASNISRRISAIGCCFSEEEYFYRLEKMLFDIAQIYEQTGQTEEDLE